MVCSCSVSNVQLINPVPESTPTALHIYNFPAPDEPFKPCLKTVLLHVAAVTRASWNPVRPETLAVCCSRPGVYMWTANSEWISENVGEFETEVAECIGVPGRGYFWPNSAESMLTLCFQRS